MAPEMWPTGSRFVVLIGLLAVAGCQAPASTPAGPGQQGGTVAPANRAPGPGLPRPLLKFSGGSADN